MDSVGGSSEKLTRGVLSSDESFGLVSAGRNGTGTANGSPIVVEGGDASGGEADFCDGKEVAVTDACRR